MGKSISLFSGYSQSENRVTNYCLLMLKMLYEENPKFLGEILSELTAGRLGSDVGVTFRQQVKVGDSVPDGLIVQSPISIHIETKNWDWFHSGQLERHLDALAAQRVGGSKTLIALSRFEKPTEERFREVRRYRDDNYRDSVEFEVVTFDEFINSFSSLDLPKNLRDAVSDLREFFDDQGLLSRWGTLLDVVNCAGIPEDIEDGGVYMCPASGGAYSHQRCRYFGMYRNKTVEQIALIRAVVDVDLSEGDSRLKWNNTDDELNEDLCALATTTVEERRPDAGPTRVFLLDALVRTDFRKDSSGGMQGSKRYFDTSGLNLQPNDVEELARALAGRGWSELV